VETLARFRPDPAVIAGLTAIDGHDEGALAPGQLPVSWVGARVIGAAIIDGRFVEIGHSESLAHLQTIMAARLIHYGIPELDGSVIREARREFTQELSLHVFSHTADDGSPPYAGIAYESRLGNEFMNWALFERAGRNPVRDPTVERIALDDHDLVATLSLFNITLVAGR
jgi:hypothetical protein